MEPTHPHKCLFEGCGKLFKHHAHLVRHERSHDLQNLFVCQICRKSFNRKDSLQRHLALHGQGTEIPSSGKVKRACITCHITKLKCDGNVKCSRCLKKGIDCLYPEHGDDNAMSDVLLEQSDQGISSSTPLETLTTREDKLLSQQTGQDLSPWSASDPVISAHPSGRAVNQDHVASQLSRAARTTGLVDWLSARIEKDHDTLSREETDPTSELFLNAYFTSFHVRWPIVHRPSLYMVESSILIPSVKMIGAWLTGKSDNQKLAVSAHGDLVEQIISQLLQVTSRDRFQQSLSNELCVSALLSIVFAVYLGSDKALSRAAFLRNILLAALHEVGFFRFTESWPDEDPRMFLPMRMVKKGQRSWLAVSILKIDAFLSIIRDQPTLIYLEELQTSIPTTFALWNSDGLHVWEERQVIEPIYRSQTSLFSHIHDSQTASFESQTLLIEDIENCFCALQSDIWRSWRCPPKINGKESASAESETLKLRIDNLKSRLDQLRIQMSHETQFGHESDLPLLRCYYGYEDPSQTGWQETVKSRVQSLFFDSTMLYHLLSLHLCVNVRTLTQVAKDRHQTSSQQASDVYQEARSKRENYCRSWVATSSARRGISHCTEILTSYKAYYESTSTPSHSHPLPDPMNYVALCTAALTVWVFCRFSIPRCNTCKPGYRDGIESTKMDDGEREAWINGVDNCRPQLQCVDLCKCKSELLMGLYKRFLPEDWGIADMISPGIFAGFHAE